MNNELPDYIPSAERKNLEGILACELTLNWREELKDCFVADIPTAPMETDDPEEPPHSRYVFILKVDEQMQTGPDDRIPWLLTVSHRFYDETPGDSHVIYPSDWRAYGSLIPDEATAEANFRLGKQIAEWLVITDRWKQLIAPKWLRELNYFFCSE